MLPDERADLLLLPESLSITTLMPSMLAVHGVGGGGLVSSAGEGVALMKRRSHCQPEVQLVVQLTLSWSCRRVVCALALLRLVLRMWRTHGRPRHKRAVADAVAARRIYQEILARRRPPRAVTKVR